MPTIEQVAQPTLKQLHAMEPLLRSRRWRLNNLYYIIDQSGRQVLFKLNAAQDKLLRERHTRNVVLKARQLGFTTFIDIFGLDLVVWNPNIRAGIIAHTRDDAGIIFRDKIQYAYDHLPAFMTRGPKAWFPPIKNDAGELMLSTNSSIRVGTSFRSATAQFLHISEYGAICARYPAKANEIKNGALPAVHEGGFIFVESTAKGNEGEFYDLCQRARQDTVRGNLSPLAFKFHFYPWHMSASYRIAADGVMIPDRLAEYFAKVEAAAGIIIDPEQRAWYAETERNLGGDMKSEHPSTPEEAFEQSIEGAYYRPQMDKAFAEGRVCEGALEPSLPVHTGWDIGHGDSTAIWFIQAVGDDIRVVDYYENSGEGLDHYAGVLRERGYRYGKHYGPHDLKVHEWTSGKTRIESAALEHGIHFEVAPSVDLADGIEAVRATLRRCWFWESKCDQGVKHLQNYRKEWDADKGTWKNAPRHDAASHGADAFRYLCLCVRPGLSEMRVEQQQPGATGRKWGYR